MAAQGPTLLFVNYDDPLHPSKAYRTPIRQHVMRQAMVQRRSGGMKLKKYRWEPASEVPDRSAPVAIPVRLSALPKGHCQGPKAAAPETLPDLPLADGIETELTEVTDDSAGLRTSTCRKQQSSNRVLEAQIKYLLPDLSYQRVLRAAKPPNGYGERYAADMGEWYFLGPNNGCTTSCGSAAHHLSTNLWSMMVQDDELFACLGALAFRKRMLILSITHDEHYLSHKGLIMRNIRRLLTTWGAVKSQAVMAMVTLSHLQICDEEFEAAEAHLKGLRHLAPGQNLSELEWFLLAWNNVRLALFMQQAPILPLYVPEAFRAPSAGLDQQAQMAMKQRALANLDLLPTVSSVGREQTFALLYKLHWLSQKELHRSTHAQPLFGTTYEMDYGLRIVDAALRDMQTDTPLRAAFELVLTSMQLHAWIVTRHWVPQHVEAYQHVLRQSAALLPAADEPLEDWRLRIDLEVLLWILTTITTVNRDLRIVSHARLKRLLTHVIKAMRIRSFEAFCEVLKLWPWSEEWHPVRCETVWAEIRDEIETSDPVAFNGLSPEATDLLALSAKALGLRDRWSAYCCYEHIFLGRAFQATIEARAGILRGWCSGARATDVSIECGYFESAA